MVDPWLTIIGIGEDGIAGLSEASRAALAGADVVFGAPRHLHLAGVTVKGEAWPTPFSVAPVLSRRGERVAVLASGDPFWFGAGGTLAQHLPADEYRAYPAPSTFQLAAVRLGWRLEQVRCFGLHAAPFETLLPALSQGARVLCLVRDARAVATFARWLVERGFEASQMSVLEMLGGPGERIRASTPKDYGFDDVRAPVAVALEVVGACGLPHTPGLADERFVHDGQITKRPVRALTLSALGPRPGELLWDIGAGSGSVSVEWCLAGGRAVAVEARADRAANIRTNRDAFGVAAILEVIEGQAPGALSGLPKPHAVFIGGGANEALLSAVWASLAPGTRLVANAVTLETEALFGLWRAKAGGALLRIELASAEPLGAMSAWTPARPVVQWSATR